MSSVDEPDFIILEPKSVGVFHSRLDEDIIINHPVGYKPQTLAEKGFVDAVIVDTEDGFSQLGMMRRFLSADLGLAEKDLVKWVLNGFPDNLEKSISSLADWNRARTPEVTLVAIPSHRPGSHLKGLILSPYESSECYKQFAVPMYGRPHRDFMYNVTYEAISYAYRAWNARRIGITHFSRSKCAGKYHRDLTTCQVEAMMHFCNEHKGIESFTFLDGNEGNHPLGILAEFNNLPDIGIHRKIRTKELEFWGINFVDLDWNDR